MRLLDLYFSWWLRPGMIRFLRVGDLTRSYVVHLPNGRLPTAPLPVVLALHGATMNGPMMAWFSGLNRKSDQAGFLVAYPNGTGEHSSFFWNGGDCCGSAVRTKVDDVAFLDALLDDLARAYPVDARRVYATGMSNGAIMAYRLASELSERVAAVAPVAGSVGTEAIRPKRPVSVLHFHGTKDEYVPFTGGRGRRSITGVSHRPVEDSVRMWVKANGCDETPAVDVLADGADGMKATRSTYGAGRDGTEVALVVIDGGGHTWPGRRADLMLLGRSTLNVSANDLMWEFFQKHPLKAKE
jgi:polyhydroxybutyrate depolymerase